MKIRHLRARGPASPSTRLVSTHDATNSQGTRSLVRGYSIDGAPYFRLMDGNELKPHGEGQFLEVKTGEIWTVTGRRF